MTTGSEEDGKPPRLSKSEKRKLLKAKKEDKRKQPSTVVNARTEKTPIPGPPVAEDPDARMMFRLGLMDHAGSWSFAGLSEDHVKLIAATCKGFETMTRGEFMNRPGNKPIPVENICSEAQARFVAIDLEQFDPIWELRLAGEPRLWGLLDGHCFYVVWWDPNHEVCPSTMKHT